MVDVLFVTPDSSLAAYQDLANLYSAIEPPTWSLLLASSVKKNGSMPPSLIVMLKNCHSMIA